MPTPRTRPWIASLVALVAAACSSGGAEPGPGPAACDMGTVEACDCGGARGLRACGADGSFAPCGCDDLSVPEAVDFGPVAPGTSRERTLAVSYRGAADLPIASARLERGARFRIVSAPERVPGHGATASPPATNRPGTRTSRPSTAPAGDAFRPRRCSRGATPRIAMAHLIAPVVAALLVAVPATARPSPDELENRRNLQLELRLDDSLRELHVEPRNAAVPALGFGLLAAGGAVWVASETDSRGTWAVILGHLAAGALTDAAILAATPDPGRACADAYRRLPSDTPEALAHRVAVGERCLEAAAQREASLRLTRAFRTAALGAATVALWGTEPKAVRDETLLWIAGADGLFALFQLFPGNTERALDAYREEKAAEVRVVPNPILDTAGRAAPGLGLAIRL